MYQARASLLIGLLLLAVACGGDDGQTSTVCTRKSDCATGQDCLQGYCVSVSDVVDLEGEVATGDAAEVDDNAQDSAADSSTDVAEASDVKPDAPDVADVPDVPDVPDVVPEADNTKPTVASTDPAAEADDVPIPFVVKVVFSEPMKVVTIYDQSFAVRDIAGNKIPGAITFEAGDTTAVFTPTQGLFASSSYTVELKGSVIQDAAGNRLEDWVTYTFYTRPPLNQESYLALAEAYAPVINQATNPEAPQYDYLTRFNLDGNWDGLDNPQAIQTKVTQVPAVVYYDVLETYSHYYIHYVFFYPYRDTDEAAQKFGNDVSGATVVVQKYPAQAPIAVETYYKNESDEQSHAFVTGESGFVPAGSDPNAVRINGVYPQSELFPGGHYMAYLTARTHQSCLWNWEGTGAMVSYCKLSAAMKNELEGHRIQYVYKGTAETLDKAGTFPVTKEDVGYALESLLVKLWPRRLADGVVGSSSITYAPAEGRPGSGTKMGASFVTPYEGDFGRTPWAWRWNPGGAAQFYDLPRGMLYLDPAWFVATRHNHSVNFDKTTKVGFSIDYCFNPFFNIDKRSTDPACAQ
jgi:hypothetical protein